MAGLRGMGRLGSAVVLAGLGFGSVASATVVVYEPFNFAGATDGGTFAGKADSGDIGLSGTWSGAGGLYHSAGLTFGSGSTSLQVSGGDTSINNVSAGIGSISYNRPLAANVSGTVFGSFLFQQNTSSGASVGSFTIGTQNSNDTTSSYDFAAHEYGGDKSGARVHNATANPWNGTTPSLNTTYMYLFQIQGVGSSNETMKAWVLTSSQFDAYKAAGKLDPADLTASFTANGTGTANNQVAEYGSVTTAYTGTISSNDFLNLFSYNGNATTFDEFRVSDASLDDATPVVPEPATLGLLGLGAMGLLARRRRA